MDTAVLSEILDVEKIAYKKDGITAPLTSFKIGGPADIIISPANEAELTVAADACRKAGLPFMILGRGSNLLISDSGVDGAVIHVAGGLDKIILLPDGTVFCGAGASLSSLCNFCMERGLSSLEFAYGIPGSVGGAVYMNAGAYGGEIGNTVVSVRYIDTDGSIKTAKGEELAFGYRKSMFCETEKVILSANFSLSSDEKANIAARMNDFINRRKDKQPLSFPSAGSVFKRPEGYFAGALIEDAGLKGFAVGGAQVSEKHAGFIINTGNATCDDVMRLIEHIKTSVYDKFGVMLEQEIIKTGR